jgi:hypothetical protein
MPYIVGNDLGQKKDPSAVVVVRQTPKGGINYYDLMDLYRWPVPLPSYTNVVSDINKVLSAPPLAGDSVLAVDQTGVGRAVVDLYRYSGVPAPLEAITITSGTTAGRDENGDHRVPKKDLVAVMEVVFGQGRLRIAKQMPLVDVLLNELRTFAVKITAAGNETFAAWREGQHDDLVLSLACAIWVGENCFCGAWDTTPTPGCRNRSILCDLPKDVMGDIFGPDPGDDDYDDRQTYGRRSSW